MTGSLHTKGKTYWTAIHFGGREYKWENTHIPVKGGSKKEANRILRERIAQYESQDGLADCDTYFHTFMLEWLDVIAIQVKPNTLHQYELLVKNSIVPYFEKKKIRLKDLRPLDIQRYYAKKMQSGCSGNTVKHHHSNIRKALQYALKQNWIPYNPADRVELPKQERYVGHYYTPEQVRVILGLVKGTVIETPVLVTALYGLRRSEVTGLKWSAIDFDKKTITILHTVTGTGNNRVCEDKTKTQSSYRTLYLVPQIEKHLKQVHAHQRMMRHCLGSAYTESDYVCTWDDGRLISPEYLSRKLKSILDANAEQYGLPVYRYHDLRHTSASMLLAEGKSLKEIGDWLGHSSPAATNRYAHLMFQSTVDMANSLASKVFDAS